MSTEMSTKNLSKIPRNVNKNFFRNSEKCQQKIFQKFREMSTKNLSKNSEN